MENGNISIIIRDTGFGIDRNQLAKIFDRFYRADDSRTKTIQGVGLGLSIVKKLSDLLKLDIKVESEPQDGTKFTITFPAK